MDEHTEPNKKSSIDMKALIRRAHRFTRHTQRLMKPEGGLYHVAWWLASNTVKAAIIMEVLNDDSTESIKEVK